MAGKSLRIADPLYGTIELNAVETAVLGTRVFQRLRNVKQLGLANLVYPGADYSRLAHSIGTCHVTGQIINVLKGETGFSISDDDEKIYRLAGLLHDVGHYPFSHTMEHVLEDVSKAKAVVPASEVAGADSEISDVPSFKFTSHEEVGALILKHDSELRAALSDCGVSPDSVAAAFTKAGGGTLRLNRLISSDLDVDRLDYLRRTARHTGLPYSNVDVDYVIRRARYDKEMGFCIDDKAVRTVDHMLVGRFLDYRQVSFHKTVKGLECLLEDLIAALVESGGLKLGREDIIKRIQGDGVDSWALFDDGAVWQKIRSLVAGTSDEVLKTKADALLHRRAPKLVGELELFLDADKTSDTNKKKSLEALAKEAIAELAQRFKLDPKLFRYWGAPIRFNKAPRNSTAEEHEALGTVFVSGSSGARPVSMLPHSMMGALADQYLSIHRIYVILPNDKNSMIAALREALARDFAPSIEGLAWKS